MLLRSVLRAKPHLRRCRSRCRHCRIFFITDPRNAGRKDLGCPFGCREAHRKRESTRRSVEYYQDAEGKKRKAIQNNRRRCWVDRPVASTAEVESVRDCDEGPGTWGKPVVEHVRAVSSLIEGRQVSRDEILEMLGKVLRQHSMARRKRLDHIVWQLNQQPP